LCAREQRLWRMLGVSVDFFEQEVQPEVRLI
jgi:hypothetical protein